MHPGIVPEKADLGPFASFCSHMLQNCHHIISVKTEPTVVIVDDAMLNRNNRAHHYRSILGEPRDLPDSILFRHPMGAVILIWVEVAFVRHVEIVALIKKLVHLGL